MNETCNYRGCNYPIREEDTDLKPETMKLCAEHGKESDEAIDSSPADMFRFFLRAQFGDYYKHESAKENQEEKS